MRVCVVAGLRSIMQVCVVVVLQAEGPLCKCVWSWCYRTKVQYASVCGRGAIGLRIIHGQKIMLVIIQDCVTECT